MLLLVGSSLCSAQKWRNYVTGEVDLVNTYLFRGMKLSDFTGFAIVDVHYKGFSLGGECGVGFDANYIETQLSLGYTTGDFKVQLRDQYLPIYQGVKADNYFNWNRTQTYHSLEAMLTYAPKKLPFKVLWSTYLSGYDQDYKIDEQGNLCWGNRAFSSYLEVTGFHKFPHMHTIAAIVGASMNKGLYTDYEKNFAVVNTRLAYMKTWIWKSAYPTVGAYLTYNPYRNKLYPIAFLSFAF